MELVLAVVEAGRGDHLGVAARFALGDLLEALDGDPCRERPEPILQAEPSLLGEVSPGVVLEVLRCGGEDRGGRGGTGPEPSNDPGFAGGGVDDNDRPVLRFRRNRGRFLPGQKEVAGDDRQGERDEEGEGCPVAEYRWLPVSGKNESIRVAVGRTDCRPGASWI